MMPSFMEYQYFFSTDILKISLFLIGIVPVFTGAMKILMVIGYQKFFRESSY